jgi:hypothetical protein
LIRNGKTINFWLDNLLDSGPLRELISGPLLPQESNLKICDLWDSQGNWDLQHLSIQLPHNISSLISAAPRPIIPNQEDVFCWKPSNNGCLNSSSAYRLAFDLTSTKLSTSCWKWLWKINTIPRVIYFCSWLVIIGFPPNFAF